MDYYNYLKSLHLIFVITWFAGLFYIVRLFVYQIEAAQNHRQKRDFTSAVCTMTYRLGTLSHGLLILASLRIDAVFTDLGKAWLQMP
jgi:putative membrane protein